MTDHHDPVSDAVSAVATADAARERRNFLKRGAAGLAAAAAAATTARAADPIGGDFPEWSTKIGERWSK